MERPLPYLPRNSVSAIPSIHSFIMQSGIIYCREMLLNRPPLAVCVTATLISTREAEAPGETINEMGGEGKTGEESRWELCMVVCCVLGVLKMALPIRK